MTSAVNLGTASAVCVFCIALGASAEIHEARRHFTPNGNFSSDSAYLPGKIGFNLADVGSVAQLDTLPAGVKGLVWLGLCSGVDAAFLKTVRPYLDKPNLFGFYLMDDPDPTGRHFRRCAPDNLKAESDWVHINLPDAKTFIVLMNLGSSKAPSFTRSYNLASTDVDLFGFCAYPCRTELHGCDLDMIDRYVAAAEAAGIPRLRMVPIYQAFGGGDWRDDSGGRYVLPTVAQEREILAKWDALVPNAEFDYAYSWGSQRRDAALVSSSDLQTVFLHHNRGNYSHSR